jgi:hypothetical protein
VHVPEDRVHEPELLKVPVPLLVKLTVPVGVVGLLEVSVTVTVHVVDAPVFTELGEHVTEVDVVWAAGGLTIMSKLPLLLTCGVSPL